MDALIKEGVSKRVATTTAGLRGTHWDPARMPPVVSITVHSLRTHDGASVVGFLMRRGGERAVVCAMHPREMTVPHYMAPEILRTGCAFWVQGSRSPNVDLRLEHETALLDLAAGQVFLRSQGFSSIVLLARPAAGHRPLSAASNPLCRAPIACRGRRPGARSILAAPGCHPRTGWCSCRRISAKSRCCETVSTRP